MKCEGNADDHCCYIQGKVCQYLKEYKDGTRRWSCGLYEKHGSWDNVYASIEYQENIQPKLDEMTNRFKEGGTIMRCGDFPRPGEKCWTCGKTG